MVQDATYERLKAARRPGESFTEAIDRILGGNEPSFLDFVGLIPRRDADDLARVIEELREEDMALEQKRWGPTRPAPGRRKRGRDL